MSFNPSELFRAPPQPGQIQEGVVGYPGTNEIVELGNEAGDGKTLVRVTMQFNASKSSPTEEGFPTGARILARLGTRIGDIPPRKTRVLVAFPGRGPLGIPDFESPGAGVIIAVIADDPEPRYFGREKVVFDFRGRDVVIMGNSVSLMSLEQRDGRTVGHVMSVSQEGGAQLVSDGSGVFAFNGEVNVKTVDAKGNLRTAVVLTHDELGLINTDDVFITAKGGQLSLIAGKYIGITSSSIGLGPNPTPATPIVVGVSGQTGMGSMSLFGSP